MKRLIFFLAVFAFLAVGMALAADPVEINPAAVDAILASGLLGVGVIALTQVVKNALKASGAVVYGISLLVSGAATLTWCLTGGGGFTILKFIGYTVLVWAVANGWYKFKAA